MIPPTTTPAAEPTEPAQPASAIDTLATQISDLISGVLALDPEQAAIRGGLSILVLLGALLIVWGLRLILRTVTERIAPAADNGAQPKKPLPIGKWSMRIVRFAVFIGAILLILRIWGFDYDDLREGPVGAAFGVAMRIALILVIALVAIELIQLAINRIFARIAARARNARRAAQVRTLAPLLAGVVTTILVVIAAMMLLSEFGVEIGPLIAGAGIVGLAVGFGAQSLVKDFLTGIFLIMEDVVSVGDVIGIGEFGGVVEEMSLRTIKLRDFDGTLHVFPYSEAQVIHNRTKSFSFAVFNLSVDYNTDLKLALQTMERVGAELKQDPDFASFILADIDVVGVDALADSAVMLKARIKTLPGKQWPVQREYLMRIKTAFDEAGVEIPYPHLKVVPSDGASAGDAMAAFNPPAADR